MRLEENVRGKGRKLSDEQVRLLELFSPEFLPTHAQRRPLHGKGFTKRS